MKAIAFILILVILFSCEAREKKMVNAEPSDKYSEFELLKENLEVKNPKNLDLTKEDLFIDTTRNSIFYKKMKEWEPSKFDVKGAEYYLKEIRTNFESVEIDLEGFSANWISLEKLNGKYVLYHRCDGNARRFKIDKDVIRFYGVHESDADIISKLVSSSKEKIEIELRTIKEKSESQIAIFSLQKLSFENVYLMDCNYGDWGLSYVVTPIEKIEHFDMIVNNCVERKRLEFTGFDKN